LLTPIPSIRTQTLDSILLQDKCIRLHVLRLDEIHPVVSGNKLFKLQHYLGNSTNNTVITFGGAYSNHLVATAFACKKKGINAIGVVRGEEPAHLSHTLQHCIHYGMKLHFSSREQYAEKDSDPFIEKLKTLYGDCSIIPEGGFGSKGAAGAAGIMQYIEKEVTHICCAAGTATTAAGLLINSDPEQKIILFPVLKGRSDMEERIHFLTAGKFKPEQLHIEDEYHFGGYAKKTPGLIQFMNDLYGEHGLPTDFVYTGKMMFAVMDLIKKDFFPPNSNICCVHTGGLQGNLSLPKNTLTF
jgi:1-aminocyclopropane-1-carboxylate deaminase